VLAIGLVLLEVVLWLVLTIPCGWGGEWLDNQCADEPSVVAALAGLSVTAFAAGLAYWKDRWRFLAVGTALTLIMLLLASRW
jgi:hypothetical protein